MERFPTSHVIGCIRSEIRRRSMENGFFSEADLKTVNVLSQQGAICAYNTMNHPVSQKQLKALLSYQNKNGKFEGAEEDNYHQYSMISIAVNSSLGFKDISLSKIFPEEKELISGSFLNNHDWKTTHKQMYGVVPHLVKRKEWHEKFIQDLDNRFNRWFDTPKRPLHDIVYFIIKKYKLQKWHIISKIYHILMLHLFLNCKSANENTLIEIVENLKWDTEGGLYNNCTDFDYIKILDVLPYKENDKKEKVVRIVKRRINNCALDLSNVLRQNNHQLFSYLIGITVLKQKASELFEEIELRDILHNISNYRIK